MTSEERLNAIWARTVEKLKEVVHEFKITEDDLHVAGDYLNRLGQSGMGRSLIDVSLALTAVAANAPGRKGTRSNLEGPYHAQHPIRPDGNIMDKPAAPDAALLTLDGTVTDVATGKPLPNAQLDFWQTDSNGLYDRKGTHLRGIVITDAQGRYRLSTVLPSDYAEHDHDPIGELFRAMGKPNTRAAHVHIKVSVGGKLVLTTQVFMPTSTFLDRDYVEGAVSDDLIVKLEPDPTAAGANNAYRARFDLGVTT
jgi:protocatechuate 3,4-dioxygenase beta subunit